MPEEISQITIISDLIKRDPAYREIIDKLEERLYNRYMIYLSSKPQFNAKTSVIPKPYLVYILSFKNSIELTKISQKYGLSETQRNQIPGVLWRIFYREAEIKNLPQMLNTELALNNIRAAYQIAIEIANLYNPISDYLGDIPMTIKRWQYEIPPESQPTTAYSIPIAPIVTPPAAAATPQPTPTTIQVTPPPIRPPAGEKMLEAMTPKERVEPEYQPDSKEIIPKVRETIERIAKMQPPISPPSTPQGHSDIEPEYLPDEAPARPNVPKSTNPANVIDLKNF